MIILNAVFSDLIHAERVSLEHAEDAEDAEDADASSSILKDAESDFFYLNTRRRVFPWSHLVTAC